MGIESLFSFLCFTNTNGGPSFFDSVETPSSGEVEPFWNRLLCQPEVMDPHVEAAPTYRTLTLVTLSSTASAKGITRSSAEAKYFKRVQRDEAAVTEASSDGPSDSCDTVSRDSIDATVTAQSSFPSRDTCTGEIGAMPYERYSPSRENTSSTTMRNANQVGYHPACRQSSVFTVHDTRLPSFQNDILSDYTSEYHHGSGGIASSQTLKVGEESFTHSTLKCFPRRLTLREEARRKQIQIASKRAREANAALYDLWIHERKKFVGKHSPHLRTECSSASSKLSIPQPFSHSSTSLPHDSFRPDVSTCTSPLYTSLVDLSRMAVVGKEGIKSSFFVNDKSLDMQTNIGKNYSPMRLYRTNDSIVSGDKASNPEEGHTSDDMVVRPTERPTVGRSVFDTSRRFPLQSSAYAESVVLKQRSQQVFVLMSLLCEAHRYSWRLHLELLQLYHYYILPILGSSRSATERMALEEALRNTGSRALGYYHTALSSFAGMDFQLFRYQHDRIWRKLFADVRQYLGVDSAAGMDSCDGLEGGKPTGTGDGTVRFTATLLHSLDLFERQHGMQMALRDATKWITWYYYSYVPCAQVEDGGAAGSTADDSRDFGEVVVKPEDYSAASSASGSRDSVSNNASDLFSPRGVSESISGVNGKSGCASHSQAREENLLFSTNDEESMGKNVTREEDIIEAPEFSQGYVSLDWQAAQDEQVRNMAYHIRLCRKLARMKGALIGSHMLITQASKNVETKSEGEGGDRTNCVTPNKDDELTQGIADAHPQSPEDCTRVSCTPFLNIKTSSSDTVSTFPSGPTPCPAGVPTADRETPAANPVICVSQKSMLPRKRFKTFKTKENFRDSVSVGCFGLSLFTFHLHRSKPRL